jgi:hypothetical protein
MKTIQFAATTAIVLSLAGAASAAEYYIYRDNGRIVLTNKTLAPSAQDVMTYHLIDATAEEIAATENVKRETTKLNRMKDSADRQAEIAAERAKIKPAPIIIEQNTVGVGISNRRHR